jgi:translation initiation factor IF-3
MIRRFGAILTKKRQSFYIRNNDIIFDHVRVFDANGKMVGDMPTSEGVKIAKSQGLDLVLVDFDSDPPVCHIGDSIQSSNKSQLDDREGYSYDPTLRPATIRFSASIDELEMERKIDILRKHLLEKRRCEVVVHLKENQTAEQEQIESVVVKILRDCQDIAKSPDYGNISLESSEIKIRVWPCNPDQTVPLMTEQVAIDSTASPEDLHLERKGHPRKFRGVRARIDPRLQIRDKHTKESE